MLALHEVKEWKNGPSILYHYNEFSTRSKIIFWFTNSSHLHRRAEQFYRSEWFFSEIFRKFFFIFNYFKWKNLCLKAFNKSPWTAKCIKTRIKYILLQSLYLVTNEDCSNYLDQIIFIKKKTYHSELFMGNL